MASFSEMASQPQIIRAYQRDLFQFLSLKEQTEGVLRHWMGTRWLVSWVSEIELFTEVVYRLITEVRGRSLGQEYVGAWTYSTRTHNLPSEKLRLLLLLITTLPRYVLLCLRRRFHQHSPTSTALNRCLELMEVAGEINLAIFYMRGTYYELGKRLLGFKSLSITPGERPSNSPTYSLLGFLLGFRLLYRLYTKLLSSPSFQRRQVPDSGSSMASQTSPPVNVDSVRLDRLHSYIKDGSVGVVPRRQIDTILEAEDPDSSSRASRPCPLCLEERTTSAITECGHIFCWFCISEWTREKRSHKSINQDSPRKARLALSGKKVEPEPLRYSEKDASIKTSYSLVSAEDNEEEPGQTRSNLDTEMAEMSLGERLRLLHPPRPNSGGDSTALSNGVENGFHDFEGDGGESAVTMIRTLAQGLHSNDNQLLDTCLSIGDERIIRGTVRSLKPDLVVPLLDVLVTRFAKGKSGSSGGASSEHATIIVSWLRNVLLLHSGYLMGRPDMVARLATLHATLEARSALRERLQMLKGRLDLVFAQARLRNPKQKLDLGYGSQTNRYIEGESSEDEELADGMDDEDDDEEDESEGSIENVELGEDSDDSNEEDDESEGGTSDVHLSGLDDDSGSEESGISDDDSIQNS